MTIRLKRVYESPSQEDGIRILVERLWPRGLTKDAAAVDVWLKEIAPSTRLRQWYRHDTARWDQFRRYYHDELDQNSASVAQLRQVIAAAARRVTFVYAARDEQHNSAVALKAYLEKNTER